MEKNCTIYIYTDREITPRLLYTLKIIFKEISGINYICTSNIDDFHSFKGAKISYGKSKIGNIPFIPDTGLLFETGISKHKPEITFDGETPILYKSNDRTGIVHFDILSASFYLLSRYEEYQPYTPDIHGRFPAYASLLYKHNLLQTPLVNLWIDLLIKQLLLIYPFLNLKQSRYSYIPTIDIDSTWAFKHKPLLRTFAGLLKSFTHFDFSDVCSRLMVLSRLIDDPFDTFKLIEEIHNDKEKPIFFFLLGKYGKYGKNIPARNSHQAALIKRLAKKFYIGIHPSYKTFNDPITLSKEISLLEQIIERPVTKSRHHFLRINIPETYRSLIKENISEDYSLGYAEAPGFRAGVCNPFSFYDLTKEEETKLKIIPLTIMDGTLKDYLLLNTKDSFELIKELNNTVRKYNGVFVSLWHNESLKDKERWRGWDNLYKQLTEYCKGNMMI